MILATAAALDIAGNDAFGAILLNVLKGAVLMFPSVQSLSDDRMISIDTSVSAGARPLIVWAHHVLGLTVIVKQNRRENDLVEKKFGDGVNHVAIDLQDGRPSWVGDMSELEIREPSITLLSVPEKEELITLKPEPDEVRIDAVFTQCARRYGGKILETGCGIEERNPLVHELTMLAVAFAAIISQQLSPKPRSSFADVSDDDSQEALHDAENLKCTISEQDLMKAPEFVFDNSKLKIRSIMGHISMFPQRSLDMNLEMPRSISIILNQLELPWKFNDQQAKWDNMLEIVRNLSVIILAFAFVRDLKNCAELPFCHKLEILSWHALIIQMNHWDGNSRI